MHRLIYTSSARTLLNDGTLRQILDAAHRNNERDGISGLLIYHEGCFLQLIEGERQAVETCFRRIKQDPRHTGCIVLSEEPVSSRMFGDWRMTFQTHRDLTGLQKKQFVDLRAVADSLSNGDLRQHPKTQAILLAFLSTFRDLDVAI
ncbi:MAG: BLUF domain-containing protein [Pseudomonadota bacterium]